MSSNRLHEGWGQIAQRWGRNTPRANPGAYSKILYVPDATSAPGTDDIACRPDLPGAIFLPSPQAPNRSRTPLLESDTLWGAHQPPVNPQTFGRGGKTWADTQRKPTLLLSLLGLLSLRAAARTLLSLLFHEPPRNTREPVSRPPDHLFRWHLPVYP